MHITAQNWLEVFMLAAFLFRMVALFRDYPRQRIADLETRLRELQEQLSAREAHISRLEAEIASWRPRFTAAELGWRARDDMRS